LVPWNLEIFRKRLEEKGMANQAYDFFRASGAWSVLLYRADIEMNLRTRDMAGFQLLDLQDYPGQGSAYVGVLDAFMDSKGLITPQEWRNFCSEVVPLFATPKFCWTEKETLTGKIDISNYSQAELEGKILSWRLVLNKKVLKQGEMNIPRGNGLLQVGQLLVKLPSVKKACKAMLELNITNSSYKNNYPLWIYPENNDRINFRNVLVATQISEEVVNKLQKGGNVLLMPNQKDCKESTVGGLFQTDYWNFRMFKTICDRNKKSASPGTLGLFMDPKHPMFKNFPTEFHTNWQWYSIIKQSYPFILDYMPVDYQPIVQVIDNIERNHKLGIVFEFNVEKGKLLVCMADLVSVKDKPEVRQFYNSMMEYMESDTFRPVMNIGADTLRKMFSAGVKVDNIKELNNISY